MAKGGWNVVVSNHRGLGGVSITSDCFYNGGWTEDVRKVIDHLHSQYPEAPLFVLGTSIGANILVKYLGEEGIKSPVSGAAAICCPWDLLICDRFINRRLVQKVYDQALMIGLKAYAQLHQPIISRLADWNGIAMARSVREFDNFATRVLGKYETVDTYYRRCSSSNFVGNVMVPLLCVSALDDPVCTREAIPWDECRANKNIVLATTQHGGHLAHFEGLNAKSLWWVRAVHEFFNVLHSSPLIHRKREIQIPQLVSYQEIDQGPYLNVTEDGMLAATGDEQTMSAETATGNEQTMSAEVAPNEPVVQSEMDKTMTSEMHKSDQMTGERITFTDGPLQPLGQDVNDIIIPVKRCINQLSRQSRKSIWLLAYIAIVSTWPVVGPAVTLFFQKKFSNFLPNALRRR
ncbi:Alcohol O-acetyltransferase [Bertholletia excelsa]